MDATAASDSRLEARLEQGEILTFDPCPFRLPTDDDLAFLLMQRPSGAIHKDITYNPARNAVTGFRQETPACAERLHSILRTFALDAATWLASLLPGYASAWQPDRASFRTEEEATRKLRLTARNDLLHFDAFPSRPTQGRRILRLFVNVNPTDPRVWVHSDTFADVFRRYGALAGLPGLTSDGWARRLGNGLVNLFQPGAAERTPYDSFMLRFHHFLKTCDEFQERSPRRLLHFPPGSAWVLFTDAVSYAELRGQYALDHSFMVPSRALALPEESPVELLTQACRGVVLPRVA